MENSQTLNIMSASDLTLETTQSQILKADSKIIILETASLLHLVLLILILFFVLCF